MDSEAIASINEEMSGRDWTCLENLTIVMHMMNLLKQLQSCIDDHAPSKTVKHDQTASQKGAMDDKGSLVSVKRKQKLFTKCRGNQGPSFYCEISIIQNYFNKAKRKAKILYNHRVLQASKNDMRKTWKFLNNQLANLRQKKLCRNSYDR